MNDDLDRTQRILHNSRVKTDEDVQSAVSDSSSTQSLELMSTQVLQELIKASDKNTSRELKELAEGESGLVARDVEKDRFEVISDNELENILRGSAPDMSDTSIGELVDEDSIEPLGEESNLDLVSTQMLRLALEGERDLEDETPDKVVDLHTDPYNRY